MAIKLGRTGQIILSVYVPSVIMGFGQGLIMPTVPELAVAFDVPAGLAAQVVTALLVGRTAFLFPSGYIVDRLGRRYALVIGPLMVIAGAIGTALTPWFAVVLGAYALIGAGDGLWSLGRELTAVEQLRPDQRGRVMSTFFGISSVGIAFGPVVGGILTSQTDYRPVFLLYAALAMVVLALAIVVAEARTRRRIGAAPALRFGSLREIDPPYRPTFLVLLFATFAAMLRTTTVQSLLPVYVVVSLGLTTADVGLVFGMTGLVTLLTIGPAGFLSDRVGRKAATVPAATFAGLAYLAFFLSHDMLSLSIAAVLLGIATGLATGSMTTFTYDIIPEAARGRFQALRRSIGEIGAFAGPILGAAIASASQPGAAFLAFAPLHFASALLLGLAARETLRRPASCRGYVCASPRDETIDC
jgi:MFS family permease